MVAPKCFFSLVLWKQMRHLFTVGSVDHNGSYKMKEVDEYSVLKNKWKIHSQLPWGCSSSAAVVLKRVMYNFGGYKEHKFLICCDLNLSHKLKWKVLELQDCSLQGYFMKSACVYLNKIVYCGYRDKISTFFVLENNKHDGNLEKAYPEHNMNSDYTSILKTAKYFRTACNLVVFIAKHIFE